MVVDVLTVDCNAQIKKFKLHVCGIRQNLKHVIGIQHLVSTKLVLMHLKLSQLMLIARNT